MIQLALVVAAGSLASGLLLAFLLRRAPTVSLQLAGLALIAVCVPLAAVLLSGWVMFHMGADVKILAVAAGSATAAVFAALVLARSITASLRRVGAASRSDRKSTRLNSSHSQISYAVFCLKKKPYMKNARTSAKSITHVK